VRAPALAIAFLTSAAWAIADEKACRFSAAEMSADLDQLEQSVAHDWSYRELRRFDTVGTFEKARAGLPTNADGATYRAILEHLVASMRDGHGGVFLPCEDRSKLRCWPFTLVDAVDGLIVDEPDASAAPLARGDRLLAVEGVPVEKLIREQEQRTPASTDPSRRERALELLRTTASEHLKLSIIDARGRRRSIQLATIPRRVSSSETVETRDLGNSVSYLRLSSFVPGDLSQWLHAAQATAAEREQLLAPARKRIDEAFDEVARSRALVIDLRGNRGGTDFLGQRVADHLLEPGYVYYSLAAQIAGVWSHADPWKPPHSSTTRYAGRVVVLVDEKTGSAADNLARCLRDDRPDIVFVGRTTGGSSGAPREVTLTKSGARVGFCTMRVYGPRGALIEGHGVEPNLPTQRRRADVARSVDVELAAALDLLGWKPPSAIGGW
jgi:carboxyl-terminal processing protease